MPDHSWMKSAVMVILTMREDDADRWDAAGIVDFVRSFSANSMGISTGGVCAFYPTEVPYHRPARGLNGRDLFGETLGAAKAQGMRTLARIDVSMAAKDVFLAHPEWFSIDAQGRPIELHGYFAACPNGAYYREFGTAIAREIYERYEIDGLWANAAQFSPWHTAQCHCAACRRKFREATGEALPLENWANPLWREYNEWRYRCVAEWCALIGEVRDATRPEAAWLPLSQVAESWDHSRRGGWDVDYTEPYEDGIILEAQRRYTNIFWTGLETRYARGLAPEKPCLIGCSYFVPWWRFHAVPAAENQAWIGQVVANGGRPQLHHSGYLSDFYDRRGMDAAKVLLRRISENDDAYVGLKPMSRVALVYSRHTLDNYAGANPEDMYLNHFRGFYNALIEARIPFDILSDKRLTEDVLERYDAVALPNLACLSDAASEALLGYARAGGHLVATYKSGFFDAMGAPRPGSPFLAALDAEYTGVTLDDLKAAYGQIRKRDHPILQGLGDTDIVPVGGNVCLIGGKGAKDSAVTFIPAVETSPGSGISVPEYNKVEFTTDAPLLLEGRLGEGSLIYFPWEPDRSGFRFGLVDMFALLTNALAQSRRWRDVVRVEGPGLIDVSVSGAPDRIAIHLVNLSAPGSFNSGVRRLMNQIMPVHDLEVTVHLPEGAAFAKARLVHAGDDLSGETGEGKVKLRVPKLAEFETILVGLG